MTIFYCKLLSICSAYSTNRKKWLRGEQKQDNNGTIGGAAKSSYKILPTIIQIDVKYSCGQKMYLFWLSYLIAS